MKLNTVICGDCLEVMRGMEDNSVDLILTDPPYGDGVAYGRNGKTIQNNEDESINYKVILILYNKLKNNKPCYIFTNWKFYPLLCDFIKNKTLFNIRMMIVIVKNNFGMGYGFRNQHELCIVLEKGNVKYNTKNFSNVQNMQHIQHDILAHPHEKGLSLIGKILLHSSNKNDIVLDPFLGSGTTAVACKELGRNYIGIEISPEYCAIAEKRLAQGILNI